MADQATQETHTNTKTNSFNWYVCILDASGSMNSYVKDTMGSLRSFQTEQAKEVDSESKFFVTTFSSPDKIRQVADMTIGDTLDFPYIAQGNTALLDAIGQTITNTRKKLSEASRKPECVYVIILTDGQENSSCKYTRSVIYDLIGSQKTDGWKFIFLGANQDAIAEGACLNITRGSCLNYAQTTEQTDCALKSVSCAILRAQHTESEVEFSQVERSMSSQVQ